MAPQPGLTTIAIDADVIAPSNDEQIQMYLNKDDGTLHGMVKGGNHEQLAVKAPNALGETTSAAPVELAINSTITTLPTRVKIPRNTALFYSYFVMATRTGGSAPGTVGATGIVQYQFLVRNLNGVTTFVVNQGASTLGTGDAEANAWSCVATLGGVDGDEVIFTVTGEANKTIKWDARIVILAELNFGA